MKSWIFTLALMCISIMANAETLPKPTVGSIERMENFASKFVDARHVDVWLPDGYSKDKRYNVIYMHDGQMLFDASTTWNKQAWHIDVVVNKLMQEKRIPDTIVVGIWNNNKSRHAEYFPQKFLPFLPEQVRAPYVKEALQGKAQGDNYLRFLVEELKPAIDKKYSTLPDAANTFTMGSSMGAMISIYAMNEYPKVFGGAAGLSAHWLGTGKPNAAHPLAAYNYLRDHLADPATHRLYMDHGTLELDAMYAPYQIFIDEIARERGYTDANMMSRSFDGTGHNEKAWTARLDIPILFLFGAK